MSYKQVIITEFGGPDVMKVVEEAALPEPAANEVRIKVQATSREPSHLQNPQHDVRGVVDVRRKLIGVPTNQFVPELPPRRQTPRGHR